MVIWYRQAWFSLLSRAISVLSFVLGHGPHLEGVAFLGSQLSTWGAYMKSLHSGWARTPPPGTMLSPVSSPLCFQILCVCSQPLAKDQRCISVWTSEALLFIPFSLLFCFTNFSCLGTPELNQISAFYPSKIFVTFVVSFYFLRREPSSKRASQWKSWEFSPVFPEGL